MHRHVAPRHAFAVDIVCNSSNTAHPVNGSGSCTAKCQPRTAPLNPPGSGVPSSLDFPAYTNDMGVDNFHVWSVICGRCLVRAVRKMENGKPLSCGLCKMIDDPWKVRATPLWDIGRRKAFVDFAKFLAKVYFICLRCIQPVPYECSVAFCGDLPELRW